MDFRNSGDYDDAVRLTLISDPGRPSLDLVRMETSKSSEINSARPIISSTENLLRPSYQTQTTSEEAPKLQKSRNLRRSANI